MIRAAKKMLLLWKKPKAIEIPSRCRPGSLAALIGPSMATARSTLPALRAHALRECERWTLEHEEASGDWGGIFPPMLNGVLALRLQGHALDSDPVRRGLEAIERFAIDEHEFKVVAMHHHLVPVPGTGRERNIVHDAGDLLRVLANNGVDLVLCGHKHVPNVWRLEDMLIVNSGTCCTHRLRGKVRPGYNIIEVHDDEGGRVRVLLKEPFVDPEVVGDYRGINQNVCGWSPGGRHVAPALDGTPAGLGTET